MRVWGNLDLVKAVAAITNTELLGTCYIKDERLAQAVAPDSHLAPSRIREAAEEGSEVALRLLPTLERLQAERHGQLTLF